MSNFFKNRSIRKQAERLLREVAHARNMREDVATGQQLEQLAKEEQLVGKALESGDAALINKACAGLSAAIEAMYPQRGKFAGLRENVEVLVVAVAVAMAFRAYFVQPFKIPTSSMYPTLNGIQYHRKDTPGFMDMFPQKLLKAAVFGEWYTEVRSKTAGRVQFARRDNEEFILVNSVPHKVPSGMQRFVRNGDIIEKNTLLANGVRVSGDHIFVNRLIWNFRKPRRGEVMVFRTDNINHPHMNQKLHYVKRMLGLPGESVSINPPHFLVNGQRLAGPEKILEIEQGENDYVGYKLAPGGILEQTSDARQLTDTEYFAIGDNQSSSFDSRYWGPVPEKNLLGPAFIVYWPFSKHWGVIR